MQEIVAIGSTPFIFSRLPAGQTASLGIFLKSGARQEGRGQKGAAHFLEHLLFKGSKNYSHRQIKRQIEGRGGSLNAFTSQENTAYYAHFLNKNLIPTLDILLDMVCCPLLRRGDAEKERRVILEEIKMYNDLPAQRAVMCLDKLLWPNHPLGEEVVGTFSSLSRMQRQDLCRFKNKHYLASNMVISCCADFPQEEIVKLLKRRIGKTTLKARPRFKAPRARRGLSLYLEQRPLEQSHLCLGFRAPSYLSQQRFAAGLLNIILGANMSSRLFEELRERRPLCYDIASECRSYRDSGAFVVHLGVARGKIGLALTRVLKELAKIKTKPVSSSELSRARDFFLGHMIMGLERPGGRMFYNADSFIKRGKIATLSEMKAAVDKVDSAQIRALARKVFNFANASVSGVGDIGKACEAKIRNIFSRF